MVWRWRERQSLDASSMPAISPEGPKIGAALQVKPLRTVIEKVLGLHRDAPMPKANTQTITGWLKKRKKPVKAATRGPVVFFHGCAGGYFEVETSKKSIEVLEYLGYEVLVPKQGCCGLAQQSNGLFDGATDKVLKLCDGLDWVEVAPSPKSQDTSATTPSGSLDGEESNEQTRKLHEVVKAAVGGWLLGGAPDGAMTTDHMVAMADAVPVVAVMPP